MPQYGIRTRSGNIITDETWDHIAPVISGFKAFDIRQGKDAGVLVVKKTEDSDWEEVEDGA